MALKTLTHGSDAGNVLAAIDADGAVIVEDFVSADLRARLNRDLDRAIFDTEPGSRSDSALWVGFHGANTKRFTRLAALSPAFVEFMEHPLMQVWADSTLLPMAGGYWLNTGQAMVIGPGQSAQVLHRDQENWPVFNAIGVAAPEITVSCMVALTDFTDEGGATRVVPGSQHWDDFSYRPDPVDTLPAEMSAGSALLYSGKVIHGGGANRTTDVWRRGLHMSFVVGWLTPEEAHTLAVPWELAATFPERVQRLLGYGSYDPGDRPGGRLWLVDFDDARAALA